MIRSRLYPRSMPRVLRILIAVSLFVGLIFVALNSQKEALTVLEPALSSAVETTDRSALPLPRHRAPELREGQEQPIRFIEEQQLVMEAHGAIVKEIPMLYGTAAMREEDGTMRYAQDGVIEISRYGFETLRPVSARVDYGQWEIPLSAFNNASSIAIHSLHLDGRPLQIDHPKGKFMFYTGVELEVEGVVPESLILNVVDEQNGQPMTDIVLLRYISSIAPGDDYEERVLSDELDSPINLSQEFRYWDPARSSAMVVGAAGYAWKVMKTDYKTGGEVTLTLQPAGTLNLSFAGDAIPPGSRLYVRTADASGTLIFAQTLNEVGENAPRLLTGLAPGNVRVTVETPRRDPQPGILGEAIVTIRAGTSTSETIITSPPR
ncbi:MAG: hypothetical protein ACI8X5_000657 [Planctomycetota bacterium]|jgi:hypothetical protein